MFFNISYFKLFININIINNIIYSELLRTIVLELLGSFVEKIKVLNNCLLGSKEHILRQRIIKYKFIQR